jgi:hypothetical protein
VTDYGIDIPGISTWWLSDQVERQYRLQMEKLPLPGIIIFEAESGSAE